MLLKVIYICLVVILTVACTAESVTFDLNDGLVEVDLLQNEIKYADYELTAVGISLCLSSRTYFVELQSDEKAQAIHWQTTPSRLIARLQNTDPWADLPTALDNSKTQPSSRIQLGSTPVWLDGSVSKDDRRYARILVFPVTVDSVGDCYFVDSISIRVGDRLLMEDQLLSPSDLAVEEENKRIDRWLTSSDSSPVYVIITDTVLLEPCEQLAAYKNSTGFATATIMIKDILATYAGRDDAEKLREYLKGFHAVGGQYALLTGDESLVPIRYAYHRSTTIEPDLSTLKQCDLYFADLTGDWNTDGDNVWGEPVSDEPDLVPELRIGRLPFNTAQEMSAYVDKLITYETNPGDGQSEYLERAFFFSSDQMRDYSEGGQHNRIAQAYPDQFIIDTTHGVEAASGSDLNPTNVPASELHDDLSEGFGIVNIIAHGCHTTFEVRTSGYNNFPKSYFYSGEPSEEHGSFDSLTRNDRTSFYYSLACNGATFDKDQPPLNLSGYPLCSQLLALPNAGAVGLVGYSRSGWVGTSHYLQRAFFDSLFAHPDRPAVDAMNASTAKYYYYRDLVYSQNFLGDPTLRIYTSIPTSIDLIIQPTQSGLVATATSGAMLLDSCLMVLSIGGTFVESALTEPDGQVVFLSSLSLGLQYTIAAVKAGHTIARTSYSPLITTDIDDETILPSGFVLEQNYPNPFNPSTSIAFELPNRADVDLSIFNVLGQKVATIAEGSMSAGRHAVIWNAIDQSGQAVASGMYFYRLSTCEITRSKKMLLVR
ncbi:MAG: T9SS type A sorting domain-containing protein [candidate division Zixibacteria bacterium]|nr:T9SS type A sorting domain-containing protein [candidate division Zixibacteria bacterium]